ncbi:MAG TPA: hypothetical protein VHJ17_15185, partial [Thermomonospora sp.]|nr:hypothetical protein [Thermomonospora sp.]
GGPRPVVRSGVPRRGAKVLCLTCRRVRPARSPAEYTRARAELITRHGLCVCAHTGRTGPPHRGTHPGPAADA